MNRDQEALDRKWEEVRQAELGEVATRRAKAEIQGDPHANLTGLALSGGGIRSASFNLGVLQALVEKGLFRYVDFLSTVSGGGYIGSFISSLAYRQHFDEENAKLRQAPNVAAPGYVPPPIAPKEDGSQPEATKLLARHSDFLNDKLDAISRYLIGWFLNFMTLFSGLVLASTAVALLWRLVDMSAAANFMLFFSGGLIQDWSRPFLPAGVFFLAWVVIWSWSYFRKGSVASARHSGKLLVLSVVCLLIGFAIALGTPNMNLTSKPVLSYDQLLGLWNGNQQWLTPLAIAWAITMLPLLRPQELLKSGTDTKSRWRGWVFTIAGYGVVIGIPFATVYFIGRHNVSGAADVWQRNLVADDIINWEKFWWQIRDDAQRRDERLTPAVVFLAEIMPKNKEKKNTFQEIIENDKELYRMQNFRVSEQPIGKFFTDLYDKETIAKLATKALDVDYLKSYLDVLAWQAKVKTAAKLDRPLFEEALQAYRADRRMVVTAQNQVDLDRTKPADLALFFQDWKKAADRRLKDYEGLPQDQDETKAFIQSVRQLKDKIDELLFDLSYTNYKVLWSYHDEIDRRIKDILNDPEPRDPKAAAEAKYLASVIELYHFYHLRALSQDGVKENYKAEVNEDWLAKQYPRHEVGHLLLRLYYPAYLRPIQFANRPLVIVPDQWARLWILLISGGVFGFFGSVINFNGTSMHGFYRRCIQRAFLVRHATTEDERDHREIALKDMSNTEEGYPYHILSGCVEVNTGSRGEPIHLTGFQFAKLYCGGREIDFCRTDSYRKGVMTLSSSAAISGAAVSPTRIHYLLLQVMMTITNLRLGQWLPNPGKNQDLSRPTFVPLLRIAAATLFSRETLEQSLVFVTDGGHYENLGLEVLLDRRCRLIIASDAGADPTFEFADLANVFALARRKGIRFVQSQPGDPKVNDEVTLESVQNAIKYCNMALWRIKYADNGAEGFCIYLKSSLVHPQPFEIGQYKLWNEEFPHDSTANQFFHERQFEVYRELGYKIALKMIERLQFDDKQQAKQPIDVDRLLKKGVFSK